jgi:tetratricopeptide (TPR) repeat protein
MQTQPLSGATITVLFTGMIFVSCLLMYLMARFLRGQDALGRGLDLALTGHPAEAEQCYRKALAAGERLAPDKRRSLLNCLGDALLDMGRYGEARQCLDNSLALGDPTGSCRSSLADFWLLLGREPDQALEMADQALEASTDGFGEITSLGPRYTWMADVLRAGLWAKRAHALARLGRQAESQESIDFALKLATVTRESLSSRRHPVGRFFVVAAIGVANTYWHAGMAYLAMGKLDEARDHFTIGSGADVKRKYGARCRQQLAKMGVTA